MQHDHFNFTMSLWKLWLTLAIFGTCTMTTTVHGFSLWFGSPSSSDYYRESPFPPAAGPPPIDYGECDWYDPALAMPSHPPPHFQPQPLSTFTSGPGGALGYDSYDGFEPGASISYRGSHRSPYPYVNQNPFSTVTPSFGPTSTFGFMSMPNEPYDANDLTAAHRTLPIGSYVTVINENNNRSVVVRIVDNRGPNVVGRVMTLSQAAFHQIADLDERTVPCYVSVK